MTAVPAEAEAEAGAADEVGMAALRELVTAHDDRFRPRPEPGPAQERRTLTVGMATYDDYDGVYFTVMSLLLYHAEAMDRVSFLVVDNHPSGPHAWALKRLEQDFPQLRYIPYDRRVGTAARDRIFREAASDWVMCVDSHVQLAPGALAALLGHIDRHPDSGDLLQGPLVSADGQRVATHWEPRWERLMYGVWGSDPRGTDPGAAPFEIGMQGLGVFACRTSAWPGLNPAFARHGGEEGHLHDKFRRAGGTTWCLPALRWTHRFDTPRAGRTGSTWYQRLFNYLIGFDELGQSPDEAIDHFTAVLGDRAVRRGVADYQAEKRNPFNTFGGITCINLDERPDRWQAVQGRMVGLGIRPERLHRQPAVATPDDPRVGRALSHRQAVQQAHTDALESLLVVEDDTLFRPDTVGLLRGALAELGHRPWSLLHLDGAGCADEVGGEPEGEDGGAVAPPAEGGRVRAVAGPGPYPAARAVAYHRSAFTRLLDELPDTVEGMAAWIGSHTSLDRYLAGLETPDRYRVVPAVAAPTRQVGPPAAALGERAAR